MNHLFHYDGILHWCFQLSIFGLAVSMVWVTLRVLLPLRRLAKAARSLDEGDLSLFTQPVGGIREIEQLRQALRQMTLRVQEAQAREAAYRNALTDIQEQERQRIARELHDDTIQSLVVVAHGIERAAETEGINAAVCKHLELARGHLIGIIDHLRGMIANLRPTVLDELGLISAIEMLCEEESRLDFHVNGRAYNMEQPLELAILRVAQETVRNAARHAHAHHIRATLSYQPSGVTFSIIDDGIGFEPPTQLQDFATYGHYGLVGIRERVAQLGGRLQLSSAVGRGTNITVSFPRLETRQALAVG